MITVYGIKNCDTCRKARKWLEAEGIAHSFHDFRDDGLDEKTVASWLAELGDETLINRRGTTWRKLSEKERASAEGAGAATLIAANPTLIKRPVFDLGPKRLVGFAKDAQAELLKAG